MNRMIQFSKISELITPEVKRVALVGHERPDGDCAGAVLGTRQYLLDCFPGLTADAYLEPLTADIAFLRDGVPVREDGGKAEFYDLAVALDCAALDRIGAGRGAFAEAKSRANIDHHATNGLYGDEGKNYVVPGAASACEVLCDVFDADGIREKTAECLYTGIIHDTGVFRYEAVTGDTLRKAAALMDIGQGKTDFSRIIRNSVTEAPYNEKRIAAAVLMESVFLPEERFLYAKASAELQKRYGVRDTQLGAVVSYLNEVREAETVLFLYEKADGSWKGSIRTKDRVDATVPAVMFGGGGHLRAAGFTCPGDPDEAIEAVRRLTKELLAETAE